jgi:hypothetical protein
VTYWLLRALAGSVCEQGLVDHLAPEALRRWLQIADLRSHRYRSWLYGSDPLLGERPTERSRGASVPLDLHRPAQGRVTV